MLWCEQLHEDALRVMNALQLKLGDCLNDCLVDYVFK